jgi:hypothetical protein
MDLIGQFVKPCHGSRIFIRMPFERDVTSDEDSIDGAKFFDAATRIMGDARANRSTSVKVRRPGRS